MYPVSTLIGPRDRLLAGLTAREYMLIHDYEAMRQTRFRFKKWGGKRKGAGRKPRGARALVPHLTRRIVAGTRPVHVTMRAVAGLPSFRERILFAVFEDALARAPSGRARDTFRVVHYSVQADHVHLLVEADD